jgi:hypothetical protein
MAASRRHMLDRHWSNTLLDWCRGTYHNTLLQSSRPYFLAPQTHLDEKSRDIHVGISQSSHFRLLLQRCHIIEMALSWGYTSWGVGPWHWVRHSCPWLEASIPFQNDDAHAHGQCRCGSPSHFRGREYWSQHTRIWSGPVGVQRLQPRGRYRISWSVLSR